MVGLIKTLTFVMKKRVRQKTHARISNQLKERISIETDRGNLNFRIDSAASIPRGPDDDKGEPETFEWISKFLQPGEVLIDIGANIGVFSLYAALIKDTKIIALEPSAESFATLNANIRLNGLEEKIEAYCLAASNETKLMKLFMKDTESGASHNSIEKSENQFGAFKVGGEQAIISIKLDHLTELIGSTRPDHIKLDVDGREPAILEGAINLLETVKSILVEIEGKNLADHFQKMNILLESTGLKEDKTWRDKGSRRNRLFVRN